MLNVPTMRTISQLAKEIKEADPNTQITESAIRRLVKKGVLPTISAGRKKLVCVEVFNEIIKKGI